MSTKQEFRNALKNKRNSLSNEQRKEWDVAIIKRIAASECFKNARELLLYAPVGSELNLLPLARAAQMQGKRIAFPRCDTESNTLRFYYLEPNARLVSGAYHIPEPPADAPLCVPTQHSLCIVPALTFDLSGARLGYGKGYYDRFLADFPGVAIGAVYSALLVRRVPTEPHDLPVSMIFTEIGLRKCRTEERPTAAKPSDTADTAPDATKKASGKSSFSAFFKQLAAKKSRDAHRSATPPVEASVVKKDSPAGDIPVAEPSHALHNPPILVAVTFVLLLLSRLIDTRLTTRNNEFLVVILLQLIIFAVSATLSPLAAEEELASLKPITLPPSSSIAASKLRRVRVEGSKNRVASFL